MLSLLDAEILVTCGLDIPVVLQEAAEQQENTNPIISPIYWFMAFCIYLAMITKTSEA